MTSGPSRGAVLSAEIPGFSPHQGHTRSPMELTARERAILDFERSWWCFPGPKESAIRARLGVSTSHYYRVLSELLEKPAAFEYAPLPAKRIRPYRDDRRRSRLDGRRADPRTQ